jgi:hypothetical protein
LSVTASGAPEPTYQWNFNGTAIAGANGRSLSVSSVRTSDAGSYTVTVTNSLGVVTSTAATLTVNAAGNPPPASGGGGGGGGAPSLWFVISVMLLGAARRCRGR